MGDQKKHEELTIAAGKFLKEEAYWKNKLSGNLFKAFFPYDYIEPAHQESKIRDLKFSFPEKINKILIKLANDSDYRLYMILSAVLLIEIYKYTGQEDIILGTSIERQQKEGEYINTVLPLRNRLHTRMTFKELLLQVRQTFSEAMDNRNYPIESILYNLNPFHTEQEFLLFDIVCLLENIHSIDYIGQIPYNLCFCFLRTGGDVSVEVLYNALSYQQATIEKIIHHYKIIMEQVLFHLELRLPHIQVLSPREKNRLLVDFNTAKSDFPFHKTLEQLFEEQVERTPHNTAVVFAEHHLTYRPFNEKANQLAHLLREKGTGPDTVIGLMVDVSPEMVMGMTAILKAGGAFLPIEPDYPGNRIQYMIDDSQPPLVLTKTPFKDKIKFIGPTPHQVGIIDLNDHPSVFKGDASNLPKIIQPRHLSYVIYTSGSTGKPKGVMIQHRSIVNQIFGFKQMFYSDGLLLNHMLIAPFTFDPSVQHVFSPLTYGAALFLVPGAIKEDAQQLMNFILVNNIDIFDGVPSQIDILLEVLKDFNRMNFKYILLAGEVFSKNLYYKITNKVNAGSVFNIYGPTEATINTTMFECNDNDIDNHITIPIGKPLMNYKVFILDSDLNLMPVGIPGEICIGGAGLARGYINKPGLTAEKYIENPYARGQFMYRTGDFARWLPNGYLEFLGRIDHQVKIRGQRIELDEIERCLSRHPAVKEAVVIAREDKNKIKYLSAYMVPYEQLKSSEIREYLIDSLPDYMVPGHFVQLEEIPLTSNGKVDRKKLQSIEKSTVVDAEYVPPRNQLEEELVEIWKNELQLEQVGITDNYFNIGGDSIKSVHLVNIINEKQQAELKIVDLYTNNTIEELAELIRQNKGKDEKNDAIYEEYQAAQQKIEALKNKIMGRK